MGGTAGRLRSVGVPQRFAFLVCYQRLPPPFYLSSLSPRSANDPKMISLSLPTLSFIFHFISFVLWLSFHFWLASFLFYFSPLVPRSYPYCHAPAPTSTQDVQAQSCYESLKRATAESVSARFPPNRLLVEHRRRRRVHPWARKPHEKNITQRGCAQAHNQLKP